MKRACFRVGFLAVYLLSSASGWAQWGEIKKEQIEDSYLRNDEADILEADNASMTINAINPSDPEQALLVLQNAGATVLSASANGAIKATTGQFVDMGAADVVTQNFGGQDDRAVPVMENSSESPRQVIYYGTCSDGTVNYTSDGFRTSYASGCTPVVAILPLGLIPDDGGNERYLYWTTLTSSNSAGFSYKIYMSLAEVEPGSAQWTEINTDITTTVTVHWQSMGWVE